MLTAGDRAPDFNLATVGGQSTSLAHILQGGHNALLVFLRHLG